MASLRNPAYDAFKSVAADDVCEGERAEWCDTHTCSPHSGCSECWPGRCPFCGFPTANPGWMCARCDDSAQRKESA